MKTPDVAAIKKYIDICFRDAFESENREMHEGDYLFPFIITHNTLNDEMILHPIGKYCRYNRVDRKVFGRLKNNLPKNFGIQFNMSDDFAVDDYKIISNGGNQIDPNHTVAKIKLMRPNGKIWYYWISYINRDYDTGVDFTKPIPAIRLYNLVMKYHGFTSDDELKSFIEGDGNKYKHLPDEIYTNWKRFRQLYKETFDKEVDADFKIYHSDDIEILYE